MFRFFSLNYICFALVFLLQVITIRLFGAEVFGAYAVYLAFMALTEAPLISARTEAALKILNVSNDRLRSIKFAAKKDFINSVCLMPIIAVIFFTQFDGLIALLACGTILLQSGYAHAKCYFVVTNKKIETSVFEVFVSFINVLFTFIGFYIYEFATVQHLALLYMSFAILKTITIFLLVYILEHRSKPVSAKPEPNYNPFKSALIIRSIAINALTNLDVVILATQVDIKIVAVYKIIKSLSGVSFRIIAPLWRWNLYASNRYVSGGSLQAYHKSHFDSAKITAVFLLIFCILFALAICDLMNIVYGLEIEFSHWFVFAAISAFVTNWFVAWYRIDMLFRAGANFSVLLPIFLVIANSLILYINVDLPVKIYLSCIFQATGMVLIFWILNTQNFISKKYPLIMKG